MEFVFRQVDPSQPTPPAPDEIHLREVNPQGPRELALRAVEQGLSAFEQGAGPIQRIVLQHDPTLDDMLAAAFVERLLAGQRLPEEAATFARYAADVRGGLQVTQLPLPQSLEGIYLALRHQAGADLTTPEVGRRFLADWRRMAQRILLAAEGRRNPITTPLFQDDPYSARARSFLASDRNVYAHQDVPHGERWHVRIPGGPERPVGGLLLREPKSVLWKYWARSDPAAPSGAGYLFLAVYELARHWVFSTDPKEKVQIQPLAQLLQQAELNNAKTDPDRKRATADPWFDGQRFDYTLVAAPLGGTALSDGEVLGIVKNWTRATPVGWRLPSRTTMAAAGLVAAVLGILGWAWPSSPAASRPAGPEAFGSTSPSVAAAFGGNWQGSQPVQTPPSGSEVNSAGTTATAAGWEKVLSQRRGKDHALVIALQQYDHWKPLDNPLNDARALAVVLENKYGFLVEPVLVNPTYQEFRARLLKYLKKKYPHDDDQLFIFIAGHGAIDPDTSLGYLATRNCKPEERWPYYVPFAELQDMLDQSSCKHIFLVLDVCYGGTFHKAHKGGTSTSGAAWDRDVDPEIYFLGRIKHPTRLCLTSVGKTTAPDQSHFVRRLLQALWNQDQSGMLRLRRIWSYIEALPAGPILDGFGSHDPDSDFFFIAGPESAGLRARSRLALGVAPLLNQVELAACPALSNSIPALCGAVICGLVTEELLLPPEPSW